MRIANWWLVVVLFFFLDAIGAKRLPAQDVILPEPARNALTRLTELESLSVKWSWWSQLTEFGRAKLGAGESGPQALPDVCYLVWQAGKIYKRQSDGGRPWTAPGARRDEFAFDGRILATGCPDQLSDGKPTSPVLSISLASDKPDAEYFGATDFQPMGIHIPQRLGELLRAKQLQSHVLFLLEHNGLLTSAEPAQIDGRSVVRIVMIVDNPRWGVVQKMDLGKIEKTLRDARTYSEPEIQKKIASIKRANELTSRKLKYVVDLDSDLGYAVRRWQQLSEDGRLRTQSDCTEHEKLPGYEIWLPRKCRTDYYIYEGTFPGEVFDTPLEITLMDVSEFGTKPVADEQFTLKYTIPGTQITDYTLPESKLGSGGVSYRIPANPEDLDSAVEEARELTQAMAGRDKWSNALKMALLVGNVVALGGFLVFFVVRYRRKAAKG
jgi:hypothetical protein